jgi:hypothetical protein
MARKKTGEPGTALATTGGNGALDTVKPTITISEAIHRVKTFAGEAKKSAKDSHNSKIRALEQTVGGQAKRVDESVIQQAEQLMARLALISNAKTDHYASSGNTQLIGIVKKLGAVVGELKAFMLTNRSVGLFEQFDESDYTGHPYSRSENPLDFAGPKVRKAARALLDGFNVVEDPKKGKPVDPTASVDLDELHEDARDGDDDDEEDLDPERD